MSQPPGAGLLPYGQYNSGWKAPGAAWEGVPKENAQTAAVVTPYNLGSPPAYSTNDATSLNLLHSIAGDWVVSDPYPPDSSFQGMKVHADGTFFCTNGPVRSGEIQTSNPSLREVRIGDVIGNTFIFSVTPNGKHMAGRNVHTSQLWHLEKVAMKGPRLGVRVDSQASSLSSANHHQRRRTRRTPIGSSLGSEPSSCSEITPRRLKEIVERAWQAGRASAEESNSAVSSNSWIDTDQTGPRVVSKSPPPPPAPKGGGGGGGGGAAVTQPPTLPIDRRPRIARNVPPCAGHHSRKSSKEFDGRREKLMAMLGSNNTIEQKKKVDDGNISNVACPVPSYVDLVEQPADKQVGEQEGGVRAHCRVFGEVRTRKQGSDEQQRSLNKEIIACTAADDVLQRLERSRTDGVDPNAVCLSTAAYKVARLNGKQDEFRNHVLEFIVSDVLTHGLKGWDAQALAKLLWACATAGFRSTELFGAAEDFVCSKIHINSFYRRYLRYGRPFSFLPLFTSFSTPQVHHEGLRTFRAQHLAYLVWSFATMGQKSSAVFEKVDREIVKRGLASFNSQDICMCLKGLTGQRNAACFRIAEDEVVRRGLSVFNAHEITGMVGAFAASGQRYSKLLQLLHNDTLTLSNYSFQALSSIVRGVGTLVAHEPHTSPCLCPGFFQAVETDISQRMTERGASSDILPQYMCNVVWAYSKAALHASPVFKVLAQALTKHASLQGLLNLEQIARLAWAFSTAEDKEAGGSVLALVCSDMKRWGSVQLTGADTYLLLQAISASSTDDATAACTVIAKGLTAKRIRHFKDCELVGSLRAFGGHGVHNEALSRKTVAEMAKRGMKALTTAQLATLGWVFAKWNCAPGVGLVAGESDKRALRQCTPFELSVLAWVFGKEGYVSSAERVFVEVLKRPAWAFTPKELADVVWCGFHCGFDYTQLLRGVEREVLAKGFMYYQHDASLMALLFYACLPPAAHHDWHVTKAWISLPPRLPAKEPLIAALTSLGQKPVKRHTIGQFIYSIALPEHRVVIEVCGLGGTQGGFL